MKNKIRIVSIFFSTMLLFQSFLSAQEKKKNVWSIETDPSTFVLNGYAAHIRVKPASSKHLQFGIGVYSLKYPDILIDMNDKNKNKGWAVSIDNAAALFAEYYFKGAAKKWFVGMQLGFQQFKIENDAYSGLHNNYANLLLMPSVGYVLYPFKVPLYIKPWVGIGYTSKLSGVNTIKTEEYNIAPIVPFITLHLGYTF